MTRPARYDHKVDGQPFHPPVFMRLQQLPDLRDIFEVADTEQHDRQVARNPQRPQARLRAASANDCIRLCPEARVGIDNRRGEPLEVRRLLRLDAQITQLNLSLCPRERLGTVECIAVVVLIDEIEQLRA